jgi:hypothetical protein
MTLARTRSDGAVRHEKRAAAPTQQLRDHRLFHACIDAIAAPRDRLNQPRAILAQFSAQLADALYQCVIGHGEIGPDSGKDLVLRYETSRVFDQKSQDCEGLRPQGDFVAIEDEAAAAQVEHVLIKRQA